jgi:hydroxyacylglutathione hydrolase
MEQIADDVFHLPMMLREGMNAYVIGDVLVDAGGPPFGARIVQTLRHAKHPIRLHVITQARGDHAGGSHTIVEQFGVPVWAGARDVAAVESGKVDTTGLRAPVLKLMGNFTGVKVAKGLTEGDAVGPGFVVLDVPGRTPGHIALWRESDRVLLCSDVWLNMDMKTTRRGLRPPPKSQTIDPEANRAAARRLAELEPAIVGFGHGPVLTDGAAQQLKEWVTKKL